MKNTRFSISIDRPCHEDWELMVPGTKGRFCNHCRKTVIDFTGKPDAEIAVYFRNAKRPVCGRFASDQLHKKLSFSPPDKKRKLLQRLATAFLLAPALWTPVQAQSQSQITVEKTTATPQTDKKIRLKGIIKDEITWKPLYGMEIFIEGIGRKYSNAKGEFSFVIPDSFMNKEIIITAGYTATSSPEADHTAILPQTLHVNSFTPYVELQRLPMDDLDTVIIEREAQKTIKTTVHLGATTMYIEPVIPKRPSFWKRIKNIFQ